MNARQTRHLPVRETARAPRTYSPVRTIVRPILTVDDDQSARKLVSASLSILGLTNPLVELANGEQAIEELERCLVDGAHCLPVLVVLDRSLPGISGMGVLRWMRQTPGLADVPVVMLSCHDGAHDVTQAYELGARSYLVKPVGFDALGGVIRELGLPWVLT